MSLEDKNSGVLEHFYTTESTVEFRGQERKRPDATRTEIVLAFPVRRFRGTWTANPKDVPTFSYLPLGDFNFRVSLIGTEATFVDELGAVHYTSGFSHCSKPPINKRGQLLE